MLLKRNPCFSAFLEYSLSGVIPEFVRECWEPAVYFSKHLKHSSVEIEEIPAVGRCRDCGTEYNMQETEGVCPSCKSKRWLELSGSELMIKEVRIAEADILRNAVDSAAV